MGYVETAMLLANGSLFTILAILVASRFPDVVPQEAGMAETFLA